MNEAEKREALARAGVDLATYDARVQAAIEFLETETTSLKRELVSLSVFYKLLCGRSIARQIAALERKTALYMYQSFAGKFGDPNADNIQDEIDRLSEAIVSKYNLRDIHGEYFLNELNYRQYLRRALIHLGTEELVD